MTASATKKTMRNRILAALAALVIMIVALVLFMGANTTRITNQNARYLEGSTEQTARRVDDLLTNALSSINTAATVYSETLTSATVDPYAAVANTPSSQFDYLFFTTPDGIAYNNDGRLENVSDRPYYLEGMKGTSGICAIANAAFDEQNIMVFYAPVHFNGQTVGVLCGAYREDTLTRYITTYFFGEQTTTYLCDTSGDIVARSSVFEVRAENAFDLYAGSELNNISFAQLEDAFHNSESVSFAYHSSSGPGIAYLMKLPSYDWMLLRTFPASITNSMLENANSAGIILVAGTVIAAALFIIVLVLQARRQKDQLLLEQREATRIIDASTNLFSRLLKIDLVHDSYEYLRAKNLDEDIPYSGTYSVMRKQWEATAAVPDRPLVEHLSDPAVVRAELTPEVPYLQYEYRRITSTGEEQWLQVSQLCLERDQAGQPTDVLVTIQDVTAAKAQELASHQALEEACRAAEAASRAKSDFLNAMSHDIRTPMNSIMGMTAIASMHVDDTERVRECLNNITSASKHLLGLINEVLDMAKIESGAITLVEESFDLPETMESLLTIVHPQIAAKNQELRVELADIEHEKVMGDPTRLQQVFVNIMGNAIKFTPEGGSIGLRIAELPSRVPGRGCYEFTFSDTGCGMDEAFLKTIFDPFTRANDSRVTKVEGTGLGMSIAKNVISLMNGTIEVSSEVGVGTTFVVTVQLKLSDQTEEDLSPFKGMRILVVDDDEAARLGACVMLTDMGLTATTASSGPDAITKATQAQESGTPYDVMILDWRMPEMSGIETAQAIRQATGTDTPIIIFSGYDQSAIKEEAHQAGVHVFISKPLFRSRLLQALKEVMNEEVHNPENEAELLASCGYEGRRILLTEDNDMAAAIAEELISMTGATVERAENGKVAFDTLMESEPGHYDLVLMDIQMPVMNGYDATQAIRQAASERPDLATLPIIALSADAFTEDVKHAGAAGMSAHLAKPLEIEPLVRMLREWMPS